jgi:PIN domain nuclease of toxin-antitoxin system
MRFTVSTSGCAWSCCVARQSWPARAVGLESSDRQRWTAQLTSARGEPGAAGAPRDVVYLADTHALIFFATGQLRRMGPRCRTILRRAEEGRGRVHVPAVCFFEIARLLERGRIRSHLDFDAWHDLAAAHPGLPIEPLGWDDIREARRLTGLVDPFDRLIAGTALRLEVPLLTNDERIRRSSLVRTVW